MFLNGYPYTDFHEMNMDFLLQSMNELKQAFKDFTASNSLIFADPIYHDISTTYAKNTIVIDAEGNAYIAKQNVPSGVQLGNTDYWMLVFDFEGYIERANKNFTVNYFSNVTRADHALEVGDWLVLDDVLYKVTTDIPVDGEFIIGTNIVHFTVEQFLKDFTTSITNIVNQYKNDIDASELAYQAAMQAEVDRILAGATVDSEVIDARMGADGNVYTTLGNAIRNQVGDLQDIIENLVDVEYLTFTDNTEVQRTAPTIQAASSINESILVSCNEGDIFYVKGKGGSGPRLWIFAAADSSLVAVSASGLQADDYIKLVAPAGAAYFAVNSAMGFGGSVIKGKSVNYRLYDGDEIPQNSDLDDYKTPGLYYVSSDANSQTISNKPQSAYITRAFSLIVRRSYGPNASSVEQVLFYRSMNENDIVHIRFYTGSAWSSWYSLATTYDATTSNHGLLTPTDKTWMNRTIIPQTISANSDLNDLTTDGCYYTETDAIATTILHKPDSRYSNRSFTIMVERIVKNLTTYLCQTLRFRSINRNDVIFTRVYASGSWGSWYSLATTDLASTVYDGLLSHGDKSLLAFRKEIPLLENRNYPAITSGLGDLLQLTKDHAYFHDNFHRADNASDIGYNGAGQITMEYTDISGDNQLTIGISDNKAVATNPSGYLDVKEFKVASTPTIPFKVMTSFTTKGGIVIAPKDINNYILVFCNQTSVSIEGFGDYSSLITSDSEDVGGGVHVLECVIYVDKINVYVDGVKKLSQDITSALESAGSVTRRVAGIYFDTDNIGDYAYTNFVIRVPDYNQYIAIDEAVERGDSPSEDMIGIIQTPPGTTYGVQYNNLITRGSDKSIRFELKQVDSSVRHASEIVAPIGENANDFALQSKIFSFDVYFPADFDYDDENCIIEQMHHHSDPLNYASLNPSLSLRVREDHLYFTIKSASEKVADASEIPSKVTSTEFDLGAITKGEWTHIDIYFREGYMPEHNPISAVWVNGVNKVYTKIPNTYNTIFGLYLKFGVYVGAWGSGTSMVDDRVLYFDNVILYV